MAVNLGDNTQTGFDNLLKLADDKEPPATPPSGDGKIIEDHDNIPGFREHDVWIACDKCRAEWRFVERRGVRDWALEPVAVRPAA